MDTDVGKGSDQITVERMDANGNVFIETRETTLKDRLEEYDKSHPDEPPMNLYRLCHLSGISITKLSKFSQGKAKPNRHEVVKLSQVLDS